MSGITGDLVVIGLYLLVILGVGIYASRKISGTEDYTIAGRRMGFPVLLGTLIGTAIGAGATVGKAGKAYDVGIAMFFISLAYAVGLLLFSFMAPTIRRMNIWTIPDALNLRYGKGLTIVTAVVMVLAVVALFGGQLIAVGLVVVAVLGKFGVTYQEAIIGAAVIMIFYTVLGGLLAVAYTDVVQTVIMIVAVGIILPIIILSDVGGVAAAAEYLQPAPGKFWGGLSAVYIISIFLIDIPFCLIDPSLWQRASAARDAGTIRKGMYVTAAIYFFWTFIAVFLGIMATRLIPGLGATAEGTDAAIPSLIAMYMPPVLKGLCLAAMMAIMMSTADTGLLIAGTTFSHDIVKNFKPGMSDRSLLLLARGFILVIGVLGIFFALSMRGIFDILLLAFAIFVSGIFVPTMAAIYWEKATKQAALISSVVASITVVVLYGLKLSKVLPDIEPIFISILVSFVLMYGISRLTYRPETATPRLKDLVAE